MRHSFGDHITQHLSRKHGLSQNKLAYGIDQDPAIISKMCKGERLTGVQARERVLNIIRWFRQQEVLETLTEANVLLEAAGMSRLDVAKAEEAELMQGLRKLTERTGTVSVSLEYPAISDPASPPDVADFVGREMELSYFAGKLADDHVAIIAGMPGVGKTKLAARLARHVVKPEHVFWYAFHKGESSDSVFWKLAEYLAWHGQEGLWRMMVGAQNRHTDLPPSKVLYDYLMQMLRSEKYLLCLDDFQYVDDDPHLDQLMERLLAAANAGELSLVITSRRLPAFVRAIDFSPLEGLSFSDTRRLLTDRGVVLSDNLAALLHQRTQGNAQFLTLAIATVHRVVSPSTLIESLADVIDIESFLINEVDRGLSEEEQAVMIAVAIFQDYPITRPDIEAISGEGSARKALHDLSRRHLLSLSIGAAGREYKQHPIVQAFYHDLPGRRQRQVLHSRAGAYFESEGQNDFQAARHFVVAGEYERSVRLIAASDLQMWFNQGQSQMLRKLLKRALAQDLDPKWRLAAGIALGQTHAFLGDYGKAVKCFEAALTESETSTDDNNSKRRAADLARRIGRMYGWQGEFEQAHAFMGQAWQVLGEPEVDADRAISALIHTHTGSIYYLQKQFERAEAACRKALALLAGRIAGSEEAMTYQVLGAICRAQGRWLDAAQLYERSRKVWEQLGDGHHLALLSDNIGNLCFYRGEFEQAENYYRQSLDFWQEVGSVDNSAYARLNLGSIYLVRGQWQQAESAYQQALVTWQQTGNTNVAMAYNNLGLLALAQGADRKALADFQRSIQKAPDAENYRGLAEATLRLGEVGEALVHARQSLTLAQEHGMLFEEGMTLRTLGLIALADGDQAQAREYLESSLRILESLGAHYELGRTLMELQRVIGTG